MLEHLFLIVVIVAIVAFTTGFLLAQSINKKKELPEIQQPDEETPPQEEEVIIKATEEEETIFNLVSGVETYGELTLKCYRIYLRGNRIMIQQLYYYPESKNFCEINNCWITVSLEKKTFTKHNLLPSRDNTYPLEELKAEIQKETGDGFVYFRPAWTR